MEKLYVNEMFESPQGEGFYTGLLAIFVRFAGCNLKCEFCDTKYAWDRKGSLGHTSQELFNHILDAPHLNSKFVVLTGGEPMIQDQEALTEFVVLLKKAGYYVAMETNGTKTINKFFLGVDWVTVSPKTALFQTEGDELKLLYDGTQDLEWYEQFDFKYLYLQPILPEKALMKLKGRGTVVNDMGFYAFCSAFDKVLKAVKERPIWRISFQAQKLAGFR